MPLEPPKPQVDPRIEQRKQSRPPWRASGVEKKRQEQVQRETQRREQRLEAERVAAEQQRQLDRPARRNSNARPPSARAGRCRSRRQQPPVPADRQGSAGLPQRALDKGIQGDCTVEYRVNPQGRVEDPQVVGDCHPLFIRPSLAAAQTFRYQPRLENGQPVAVPGVRNTSTTASNAERAARRPGRDVMNQDFAAFHAALAARRRGHQPQRQPQPGPDGRCRPPQRAQGWPGDGGPGLLRRRHQRLPRGGRRRVAGLQGRAQFDAKFDQVIVAEGYSARPFFWGDACRRCAGLQGDASETWEDQLKQAGDNHDGMHLPPEAPNDHGLLVINHDHQPTLHAAGIVYVDGKRKAEDVKSRPPTASASSR